MERQRSVALIIYRSSDYDRALMRGIVAYARHHGPWVFYLSGASPGLPFPQVEAVSVSGIEFRKRGARRAAGPISAVNGRYSRSGFDRFPGRWASSPPTTFADGKCLKCVNCSAPACPMK